MVKINTSAELRRDQILELLKKQKKVKVADIKNTFNISSVTVGSDLNHLEKRGLIEKNFGYAEIKEGSTNFINESNIRNFEEKKKIGRSAVKLLNDNESIILYTGSTVLQMAKQIRDIKNLIVVTSSIQIAYELGLKPNIKTILLGGFYNSETLSSFGEQSVNQLNDYNIDKLFISVNGISVENGLTIDQPFENELNRAMIKNAKKVIVLADSSKIGISRFIRVGTMSDINVLVTDDNAPQDEIVNIRQMGVEVIIV